MKKHQILSLLIFSMTVVLLMASNQQYVPVLQNTNLDSAYLYIYQEMDKYYGSFDVYSDADAGGNHFIPSGWMGDWQDITFDGEWTKTKHSGTSCIRVTYSAQGTQNNNWAGVYWQDTENNWGDKTKGYDLTGATEVRFWAKGEKGGEKIEFKAGGINRVPLDIYTEKHSPSNHYVPSGWYNGSSNMDFNDSCEYYPYSGSNCIKVVWDGTAGDNGQFWNGVMWQNPEGNWTGDNGYGINLSGATKLTFWARSPDSGLSLKFLVGYLDDPCGEVFIAQPYGFKEIDSSWKQYEIDLTGKNISDVAGGFAFIFNNAYTPGINGCTFYLDDIKFDKVVRFDTTKPYQDSFGPITIGTVKLSTEWKEYHIPLSGEDLSHVLGGFLWVANKQDNPNGATFYLDDIRYNKSSPDSLRFAVSYETTSDTGDAPLRNTAFIYDNAIAMLALMVRGTDEDWRRANILGQSFIYAQNNDRYFKDGRLRNAYQSGDLPDYLTRKARLPGWWSNDKKMWLEDHSSVSTSTGNLAWVMIALLRYYEEKKVPSYLTAATNLGTWIQTNCYDSLGAGGYTGGFDGWDSLQTKLIWKSTEHNLDLISAFTRLYQFTGDSSWQIRAKHARTFVEAMWESNAGRFWTGTDTDGVTINKTVRPLDVNAWGLMALEDVKKYGSCINWAEDSCSLTEDCGGSCGVLSGFDFNTDKDGIWWEGTAQMVIALRMKRDSAKADFYLNQLRKVQSCAPHSNGKGIVAACHDSLSTGFDWYYFNRLHLGATSWYILAERSYNPFWNKVVTNVETTMDVPKTFQLNENYPNPFDHETNIKYQLPKQAVVRLEIYNVLGWLVTTLVDETQFAGHYNVRWDGTDANLRVVQTGVYLCRFSTNDYMEVKKIIFLGQAK